MIRKGSGLYGYTLIHINNLEKVALKRQKHLNKAHIFVMRRGRFILTNMVNGLVALLMILGLIQKMKQKYFSAI